MKGKESSSSLTLAVIFNTIKLIIKVSVERGLIFFLNIISLV